jgi:predicted nucleic acid-binding protein
MLLDTNIIVDYLREKPAALAFIHGLRGKANVSTISVVEVFAGVSSRAEEGRIERLLTGTRILDVTKDIAKIAGQHIRHFQPAHGLDDFDALIAATAEHHGLKLATLNVKHFPMFPRLKAAY